LKSPSFWQNLMQYRCSTRSVILGEMQCDDHYYSTSHTSCLGEKDTSGEAATNHACAWRSLPPQWSDLPTCHHCFFREKIESYTFWTGLIYIHSPIRLHGVVLI
jgi:hypothetical protein